jgi:hypothetical protein
MEAGASRLKAASGLAQAGACHCAVWDGVGAGGDVAFPWTLLTQVLVPRMEWWGLLRIAIEGISTLARIVRFKTDPTCHEFRD